MAAAHPGLPLPRASLKACLSHGASCVCQEQSEVPQAGEMNLEAPVGTTFYLAGIAAHSTVPSAPQGNE